MGAVEQSLPGHADIVVIGGGIAGCSAALYLARAGISVVLCEKGRIAGEQSSRNWGWVRLQGRDAREVPLMLESRRLWREIAAGTGDATGFKQAGCLYLATQEKELAGHARWLKTAREFSIDTKLLSGAELKALLPGNAHRFTGALYTASDCRAEPATAVPAIAGLAQRAGASIHTQCA
ncbi:MAG: FAD-binding oxidoreductase, partial [Hyphomicrobiales bacterium]|nr:FAD-binding oxidoreductase [Hyphomicrobiales bacterium]